ncbi:ABC transporter substrate-binding protein [Halovenus rubra]|uniref:ABC transporter substrate-binding protein n=2 Tax=Halovenus rubra TaxID=869890 RepID=A0ACC7E2N2_9EURY|nr:ABC transporter substrate-binding protein [Halovenus rubra]
MRVISTSPSSTEILYALGIEPVAVSHSCDYPPAATDLPTIDVSKVDAEESAERHEQVRSATADGHLYEMETATIDAVEPDLIITQGVCGVCAVDEILVDETLTDLQSDPDVLALQASTLEDVFDCIRDVGAATGADTEATELVGSLRERIETVNRRLPDESRPRTAVLEWLDPLRQAGRWVPDVVEAAGGEYGIIASGEDSVPIDWGRLLALDPAVIVVAPCGFNLERTHRQLYELTEHQEWHELQAVKEERVYALDGSAYLTRWTPRLVDAVEHLAAVFHPETFGKPTESAGVQQLPTTAE